MRYLRDVYPTLALLWQPPHLVVWEAAKARMCLVEHSLGSARASRSSRYPPGGVEAGMGKISPRPDTSRVTRHASGKEGEPEGAVRLGGAERAFFMKGPEKGFGSGRKTVQGVWRGACFS